MENLVGTILEGKVRSIAKFGAFINLPNGKTGLVHISEVANTYVNDINEHLTVDQEVRVKVLAVDEQGRINLSIKQTQAPAPRPSHRGGPRPNDSRSNGPRRERFAAPPPQAAQTSADASFEEKLKAFMTESDSKIAGLKQYADHKPRPRRR